MINKKPDLKGLDLLVIEGDLRSLNNIERKLKDIGADVYTARSFNEAAGILFKTHIEVIIAALDLVDEQGIEMIKDYKTRFPEALFYVLADQEYDSVESSQETVRLIVDDYIRKPLDVDRFAGMVQTSIGRPGAGSTSLTVIDPLIAKVKPYFIFRSPAMRRTLYHLPQIAASEQTVLITGETGTGKELIARAIHVLSRRSSGPFVPINCGAIPESLIEGELFGHEKGAFTGAVRTRKGKFEIAGNGTLFLDEIGDMPLNLQVRLLRVLEEGNIYRIGAEKPLPVNVRVITASNADLKKAVEDGLFRKDLYYRLNVLRLHLPPLRERVEDIPLLAVHFLERAFTELGRQMPYPSLSSETIYLLERCPWKGNVRELRNIMTRVATLLPQNTRHIFPFHILPYIDETGPATPQVAEESGKQGIFVPVGTRLSDAEEMLINETLRHTNGNKTQAAKLLGISLRNLRRKLNK
ncbi:MAG TPA: sigma-54-dependent Fis family transcriptional regulator [Nitrospirae bacterium]|nr:sigma-54-dependent Fis family transcriptional regulator [Nitrospirota bacterium]